MGKVSARTRANQATSGFNAVQRRELYEMMDALQSQIDQLDLDEFVQDTVAEELQDSPSIAFAYNDVTGAITAALKQPIWENASIIFGDSGVGSVSVLVFNAVGGNDLAINSGDGGEGLYIRTRSKIVTVSATTTLEDPYTKPSASLGDHAHTIRGNFAGTGELYLDGTWQVGDLVEVVNIGAGTTVVRDGDGGEILGVDGGYSLAGTGQTVSLRKITSSQWIVTGFYTPA